MVRTLDVALGISSDALSADFTSMVGGKTVHATLNGVSGQSKNTWVSRPR